MSIIVQQMDKTTPHHEIYGAIMALGREDVLQINEMISIKLQPGTYKITNIEGVVGEGLDVLEVFDFVTTLLGKEVLKW